MMTLSQYTCTVLTSIVAHIHLQIVHMYKLPARISAEFTIKRDTETIC